jgi:hypothetical protein
MGSRSGADLEPIWSIQSITRNTRGGHDITDAIVDTIL